MATERLSALTLTTIEASCAATLEEQLTGPWVGRRVVRLPADEVIRLVAEVRAARAAQAGGSPQARCPCGCAEADDDHGQCWHSDGRHHPTRERATSVSSASGSAVVVEPPYGVRLDATFAPKTTVPPADRLHRPDCLSGQGYPCSCAINALRAQAAKDRATEDSGTVAQSGLSDPAAVVGPGSGCVKHGVVLGPGDRCFVCSTTTGADSGTVPSRTPDVSTAYGPVRGWAFGGRGSGSTGGTWTIRTEGGCGKASA